MNKKILSIFVFGLVVFGATKTFASLTFSSAAITGDTASTIDVGAGNALSLQTTNNGAITTGTGMVTVGGGLIIPMTTSLTTGIIYKGATPFIHNFALAGTDGFNTFVGLNSGNFTMTGSTGTQGSYNTALGDGVLSANTTGSDNVAIGPFTLIANTTGSDNVAIGQHSLYLNTIGNNNTTNGASSLANNTIGNNNTASGQASIFFNTTGSNNTANGYLSLLYNSTGSNNVAFGSYAGQYETGSNAFYVDNQDRTNTAGDKANAIPYGIMAPAAVNQTLHINAVVMPIQATTVAAPAYVKGGIYFDTTLNKLRVGGATGWETVTSI